MAREGDTRLDAPAGNWLGWLIGARLLLAGLSLGLAVTLDKLDVGYGNSTIWGVYWTVVAAFAATIVSALMAPRTRNPGRFATVQVAIDVTIVTALVHFSGVDSSVFTFLYALVVLYGALVLDRTGARLSAGLAALGYGFVLFGSEFGLLPATAGGAPSQPLSVLVAYWGFYTGALLVLGILANTLSAELRRTNVALNRRTHDLQRLRDLHLRTVESIGSGLITTDDVGIVTSFNPEAERISGVDAAEANGKQVEELIPGVSRVVRDALDGEFESAHGGRNRIAYRSARGEDLFLGVGASSLRGEDGHRLGQVVIFQDVTQVVSMEHELRQNERLAAVGEMAARIAHEIRNPLAAISGSVQVLQSTSAAGSSSVDRNPEHERLMGIVVREVDRLNELIRDFLLYSRPAPLKTEQIYLANLVEEVAKMSEAQSCEQIEIDLDLDWNVNVRADRAQLTAVVWNLWNNALEAIYAADGADAAGPAGGCHRLVARVRWASADQAQDAPAADRNGEGAGSVMEATRSPEALLEIEDSGTGIPSSVREMIFEPFYTTKPDGTGLGLATVQRIVEQHGGSIQVESDEHVGTCFRIRLGGLERPQ